MPSRQDLADELDTRAHAKAGPLVGELLSSLGLTTLNDAARLLLGPSSWLGPIMERLSECPFGLFHRLGTPRQGLVFVQTAQLNVGR